MTIFILSISIFFLILFIFGLLMVIRDSFIKKRRFVNKETGEKIQVLYDATVKRPNRTSTFEGVVYYSLDHFDNPFVMESSEFKSTFIELKEWKKIQKTE